MKPGAVVDPQERTSASDSALGAPVEPQEPTSAVDSHPAAPTSAADSEPAAPASADSPDAAKEREIDELRRFRVRTVPPDMRRQWMLAETPIVSTLELQDTVPPQTRDASAPDSNPATPKPLFSTPRVSSTAPTRKLPRVVPRRERSAKFAAAAAGALLLGVLANVLLHRPTQRTDPTVAIASAPEPSKPNAPEAVIVTPETQVPAAPVATVSEGPAHAESDPTPDLNKSERSTERSREPHRKVPQTSPDSSGKIPPAPKPRTETDIKSPLFGK